MAERASGGAVRRALARPSVTDWLQVAVVIVALGFAVWELRFAADLGRRAKLQNTQDLILQGTDPGILAAYAAGLRELTGSGRAHGDFNAYLVAVTPFSEYLAAIAVCHDQDLCDRALTLATFCTRAGLHMARYMVATHEYGFPFEAAAEPLLETGFMRACAGTAPEAFPGEAGARLLDYLSKSG